VIGALDVQRGSLKGDWLTVSTVVLGGGTANGVTPLSNTSYYDVDSNSVFPGQPLVQPRMFFPAVRAYALDLFFVGGNATSPATVEGFLLP
jgi:hypothetical protein